MNQDIKHLYHGSDWPEYEDLLIGNREGLKALRDAIDEALENGKSHNDIGEFLGVYCLEPEIFEKLIEQQKNTNTLGSYIGFAVIGVAFILTIIMLLLHRYG